MIIKDKILLRRDVYAIYFVIAEAEQGSYYVRTPTARHRAIEFMAGELGEGDSHSVMRWGLVG